MSTETKTELFIRLLGEALESSRATRKHRLAVRSKAAAQKFTNARNSYAASRQPRDCVQMMSDTFEDA